MPENFEISVSQSIWAVTAKYQTAQLIKQQKCISPSSGGWTSELMLPAWSGEHSFPDRLTISHCVLTWRKGPGILWDPFIRTSIQFMKGTSQTTYLLILHLWGQDFNIYILKGHKQTVGLSLKSNIYLFKLWY